MRIAGKQNTREVFRHWGGCRPSALPKPQGKRPWLSWPTDRQLRGPTTESYRKGLFTPLGRRLSSPLSYDDANSGLIHIRPASVRAFVHTSFHSSFRPSINSASSLHIGSGFCFPCPLLSLSSFWLANRSKVRTGPTVPRISATTAALQRRLPENRL